MVSDADSHIKIFGQSSDFGKCIAGYDSNSVAAYILSLTNKFKNIEVENETNLKTDSDEFFNMWLGLFSEKTIDGRTNDFFEEVYNIHREKTSMPLSEKYLAELYIRTMNKPSSHDNIIQSVMESMYDVQRKAFQEAVQNRFKKCSE